MIPIKVKLFAAVKEAVGEEVLNLEIHEETTCAEVLNYLSEHYPRAKILLKKSSIMINGVTSKCGDETMTRGDEIALLPPVSGG